MGVRFSPMILKINMLRYIFYKVKYFFQRHVRGWDDREVWNIDWSFFNWLHERLKKYRELSITIPPDKTEKEWEKELYVVITKLEIITIEENFFDDERIIIKEMKKAVLEWFNKNLENLWF